MDAMNKLSSDLQSQLRSDLMARNISNCVIELVENALDANAKNIAVRINLEKFHLEVVDDGTGLTKDQLLLVGERYYTSKSKDTRASNTTKFFGSRGEGIASIKNVSSTVMIISLVEGGDTTYCKVLSGSSSKVSESHVVRRTHGTTVIVDDVLGNLPVRQRCIKAHVELQNIQRYIQAIALMFPMVNFSIRDDTKNSEMLKIKRTYSTSATFMTLFPGAIKDPSSIVKVTSKHDNLIIKAMISQEICDTDQLQFIFVNKQYISPRNEIQTYLNQLLNKIHPSKDKNISKKFVYIVNLSCPREIYDMMLESDKCNVVFKNWQIVRKCLINLVNQLIADESAHIQDDIPEKKERPIFVAEDAFRKLNTLNTVHGLPANRKNPQDKANPEEFVIDDKSPSSPESTSLLKKPTSFERLRSPRVQKNSKKISSRPKTSNDIVRVSKNKKHYKSPRLADQGIEVTYVKSPQKNPPKGAKSIPEKKTSEDINAIVNEAESNEYAWIWKQATKKGRNVGQVKPTFEDCNIQKPHEKQCNIKKYRDVPVRNEKSHDNPDHIERYKNLTALSYQRMLKEPGHERISKKQNHYFDDDKAKEADFIVKYGYPMKNSQLFEPGETLKTKHLDTKMSAESDIFKKFMAKGRGDKPRNVEWTASVHVDDDLFPDTLIPTQIISPDEPPQLVSSKMQTKTEYTDYKRKVTDWMASLPSDYDFQHDPNKDSHTAHDNGSVTPTNQPLTQEISEEFASKNKISKTEGTDLDFSFHNRTPEKAKALRFDNFIADGKSLKNSRSQRHELSNKIQQKRNTRISRPLFKWSPRVPSKRTPIEDILNVDREISDDDNHKENHVQTNNSKALDDPMSWKCLDDHCAANTLDNVPKTDDSARKNDALVDIQNLTNLSQDSETSCPNDCNCKCHRQSKKKISMRLFDDEGLKNKPPPSEKVANDVLEGPQILKDFNPTTCDVTNELESKKVQVCEPCSLVETEILSQHFCDASMGSQNDSKYFASKAELIEKFHFKQKSKFLEASSAVDIPKGMLEVQKEMGKAHKLTDDEKKIIGNLVKPYSMQKHITLDDNGNSCIRIFPFLKKGDAKLVNIDTDKEIEDLNCGIIFTKSDIPSFKFIQQVENQFILASAFLKSSQTPLLILLDQHAVDERIRVERLFKEYTHEGEWLSTSINPPINLSVPLSYSSLFTDYQSYLEEYGIHYEFKNNQEKLFISFIKVPTCFYNRALREKNNFRGNLKSLIETLVKEILKRFTTQGNLVHTTPTELQSVLNSEACRGAVKFGDQLTPQVCIGLLEGLKSCDLPFQCAHGRPCVIPLVNLNKLKHLQSEIRKPNLDDLRNSLSLRI